MLQKISAGGPFDDEQTRTRAHTVECGSCYNRKLASRRVPDVGQGARRRGLKERARTPETSVQTLVSPERIFVPS